MSAVSRRRLVQPLILFVVLLVVAATPVAVYDWLLARHERTPQPTLSETEIVNAFHSLFYLRHNAGETAIPSFWLGVPTDQNPNDVWIVQEILTEVRPDFVIETGTFRAGGTLIWATLLEQVNPAGRVITIDVKDFIDGRKLPPIARRIDFLIGSSTDPTIVAEVTRRVKGKKVMVILDSDHSKANVLAELRTYGPLVSLGSYVLVEDTNVNGHPVLPGFGPGPMEAVDEFLAGTTEFKSDRSRERLLLTLHPKGYLKRVANPR